MFKLYSCRVIGWSTDHEPAKLNSCAADFKRCMATLAQSLTDLALSFVLRRTDMREGTPAMSGMQENGEVLLNKCY